jgi:carboxymethylenebutenolidase
MASDSMLSETVQITGHGGDPVEAYTARLTEGGPRGGMVVIHHMPGYDAGTKEIVRRFAVEGYDAICPNLYDREAPGAAPDDAAATARATGGVPDDRLVGDVAGAIEWLTALPSSNGKVATIGYCSGGRQSWLANGSLDLNAAIVCYGAFIVGTPPEGFPLQVRNLADLAPSQSGPVLGMFGNDDSHPSPEQVDEIEKLLQNNDKPYEFHRYGGTGHSFFSVDRPAYRVESAVDGWEKIFAFLGTHLAG